MKTLFIILCLVCAACFFTSCGGSGGGGGGGSSASTPPVELLEPEPENPAAGLRLIEQVNALPALAQTFGSGVAHPFTVASNDMSAINNDGFFPVVDFPLYTRTYKYIDSARQEFVLAEIKHPGILTHLDFALVDGLASTIPGLGTDNYDVRIYLDDPDTPVFEGTMEELTSGTIPGLPKPLVGGELDSAGGLYINVPMAFTSYCRIATTNVPHFHVFHFLRLPTDDDLATHTTAADLSAALVLYSNAGQNPNSQLSHPDLQTFSAVATANPGATTLIATLDGPATIVHFTLRPQGGAWSDDLLQAVRLRITFDNEPAAQVDAPLGILFGSGWNATPVASIYFGRNGNGTGYLYFPMPFLSSCAIELVNQGSTAGTFTVNARYRGALPRHDFGHFCARYVDHDNLAMDVDVNALAVTGRGKIVGMVEDISMPDTELNALEGNTRIFLDGIRTPSLVSGGHETWWQTAWYGGPMDFTVQLPTHGYPVHLAQNGIDYRSYYRLFLTDAIAFQTECALGFQHGPVNSNLDARYQILTFYYHDRNGLPGMQLTDEIDPGSPASEAQHNYSVTPAVGATQRTAVFEGRENIDVTEDGYAVSAESSFTIDILRGNNGVRLVRMSDPTAIETPQTADVFVDNIFVGEWYQAHYNPATAIVYNEQLQDERERWLEDSFEIPAEFTADKSSITVRLASNGRWTEYRYRVYCHLE